MNTHIRNGIIICAIVLLILLLAFPSRVAAQEKAVALLTPTLNSTVNGSVHFTVTGDGLQIDTNLRGLSPGPHGFHIHEFGDCTSTDGESAGAHFNPSGEKHGSPSTSPHHAGDLGNALADSQGVAKLQLTQKELGLHGEHSIIGRSVVIHERADDLKSDPAGDSGGRIACGVIGWAQ